MVIVVIFIAPMIVLMVLALRIMVIISGFALVLGISTHIGSPLLSLQPGPLGQTFVLEASSQSFKS
jgi:hypothetical protein